MSISEDDRWQTGWEKMEESERRERDIGELDEEEYRRQDREDKGLAHLEERRRREPPIGDPCERCDGAGSFWRKGPGGGLSGTRTLCTRCLGTRVEP